MRGFLLDAIYPSCCELCDRPLQGARSLCDDCKARMPRLREPFCETCGESFPGNIDEAFTCPNCRHLTFAFRFARPAMVMDEATRGLILRLKYGREIHLAAELGRMACEAFADERFAEALRARWPLVPVPLHPSRMRTRHFNQAHELAMAVSAENGLPVVSALKRIRATGTQTALTRKERLENLKGAFALTRAGRLLLAENPSGVILIDDVLTTGSTLHECARTLVAAAVPQVLAVTVMRG